MEQIHSGKINPSLVIMRECNLWYWGLLRLWPLDLPSEIMIIFCVHHIHNTYDDYADDVDRNDGNDDNDENDDDDEDYDDDDDGNDDDGDDDICVSITPSH